MKRLAVITIGAIVVAGIGPASAGLGDSDSDSWCADHATWEIRASGPVGVAVVAGAGASRDKPVQSAFACVDANAARRYGADALVNGWIDTEYGRAGYSCPRQPAAQVASCKRTSVPLPGRSSGRADSSENEWSFDVLGVGVAYDVDLSRTRTAARTPGACARDVCQEAKEYGAWADPGPADQPPPDPRCGDQCVTASDRRAEETPGAGVEGTPAPAAVGQPPDD